MPYYLVVTKVAKMIPVLDDVMNPGENEAAAETAACPPWSSCPTPSVYGARRLSSEHAVTAVWLRVLTSAGLRRPHHLGVDDVRQTATSQCEDQGPDAAVRPAATLNRHRRG